MSWSYSGDPSESDLDEVRFYSQDTDSSDQLISDEEIQFVIDQWQPINGSNIYAAAVICEVIAARFAREVTYSADGVSVGTNELQQKYEALALSLRDQYKAMTSVLGDPDVGGILFGETYDPSMKPLVWAKGMNDNPRGPIQDRGGQYPLPAIPEIDGSYR